MTRALSSSPNDLLSKAIDLAIKGNPRPLYDLLTRGSGLPGPRHSAALLEAFAAESRSRGAPVDRLLIQLAMLDPDAAPGATPLEFLPMCGVAGIAARATTDDASSPKLLEALHDCADDMRFRVRETVMAGLAEIGARRGDKLVVALSGWTDGFFHAAAVVGALSDTSWLSQIKSPDNVLARLDEAFVLARDATRAADRYPGHKALLDALNKTPAHVAARFGVPVFDLLVRWSVAKDPPLREVVENGVRGTRLAGRFANEIARVRAALAATEPTRRDPRSYVGPTRGRGAKRRR